MIAVQIRQLKIESARTISISNGCVFPSLSINDLHYLEDCCYPVITTERQDKHPECKQLLEKHAAQPQVQI